jgi:hypothetical protein
MCLELGFNYAVVSVAAVLEHKFGEAFGSEVYLYIFLASTVESGE